MPFSGAGTLSLDDDQHCQIVQPTAGATHLADKMKVVDLTSSKLWRIGSNLSKSFFLHGSRSSSGTVSMMLVIVIADYNPDSDGDPIIGTAPPAGSRFCDKHLGQCGA